MIESSHIFGPNVYANAFLRVRSYAPAHNLSLLTVQKLPGHHIVSNIVDTRHPVGAQWLSGRVLDSRPRGRGFEPHRLHCVVSLSKNINPSLVLVQPRKTRPFITEKMLMGHKESNQTKSSHNSKITRSSHIVSNIVDIKELFALCKGGNFNIHIWAWSGYSSC